MRASYGRNSLEEIGDAVRSQIKLNERVSRVVIIASDAEIQIYLLFFFFFFGEQNRLHLWNGTARRYHRGHKE